MNNKVSMLKDIPELLPKFNDEDSLMEFGVRTGITLGKLFRFMLQRGQVPHKVFGFDSFIGLPEEAEGVKKSKVWTLGNHSAAKLLNVDNADEAYKLVQKKMDEFQSSNINCTLIPGWFENTLNKDTIDKYKITQTYFINVDCDIYKSTIEVLEFLIQNKLMKQDAILRYDDWDRSCDGFQEYEAGESLAHTQIVDKYGIKFERLSKNVFKFLGY